MVQEQIAFLIRTLDNVTEEEVEDVEEDNIVEGRLHLLKLCFCNYVMLC